MTPVSQQISRKFFTSFFVSFILLGTGSVVDSG
jgi:hypothetical protein